MPDLGPHAVFIVAAYLGVAVTVLGLIAWLGLAARRVRARLATLDAAGVRRRSDRPAP